MTNPPIQSDALAALRVQIDQLDAELLRILNARAKVAQEVGDIKRAEGSPFFRPDRVSQVIDKITQANAGPLKNTKSESAPRSLTSLLRRSKTLRRRRWSRRSLNGPKMPITN